ncbi:MAG: S-methyl-5-thioribose-1-phosphate isomerase [Robiginitomaculum sp.]|nr:S-methyl-5-thioribose-1-phosphate isomerase [Robiginitomaculum sp.]
MCSSFALAWLEYAMACPAPGSANQIYSGNERGDSYGARMDTSYKNMLSQGTENIPRLSPEETRSLSLEAPTLLVDIRDPRERERDGCIKGAYPMPRGMTEFWMHESSPYFKSVFKKHEHFVFICAKGWRALLAAKLARELGYTVSILAGGIGAWRDAKLPMVQTDGERFYTLGDIEAMLPHILKRENIARYEGGKVLIGNRKDYPFAKNFVTCHSVEDVAVAIETMVTQGVGPWVAAVYAVAMQSDLSKDKPNMLEDLERAKTRLIKTRPTNTLIRSRLEDVLRVAGKALESGQNPTEAILTRIKSIMDEMYKFYGRRGQYGAKLLEEGDGVLTMCFAETSFILALAMARDAGKILTVYVPETRPYLQGARLTAPSIHEIGIDVKLVTDNMPAALMAQGKIQKYMTAADLITMDGHVVNKIGTFQNAIAAHKHNIPYFAFAWGCDRNKPNRDSVEIEFRDESEIRECRGVATTVDNINALYPAFDITPPNFVSGIITRHGTLSPYTLKNGFEE